MTASTAAAGAGEGDVTLAVIGGSGLYSLFAAAPEVDVPTPYGETSAPVSLGVLGGRRAAFLPRHGRNHQHPPHRINYRANLWALRSLGVRTVIAPAAVGGLRPELAAGSLVVPDQLVDWARTRSQSFHDRFEGEPVHAMFADPFCPVTRRSVLAAITAEGHPVADGGAIVVIDGPRFSTRAESLFFAGQGWAVVNMTAHPEAVLARELGMCYATLALVTDMDAGLQAGEGVTVAEVLAAFAANIDRVRSVLAAAAALLPDQECDHCGPTVDVKG